MFRLHNVWHSTTICGVVLWRETSCWEFSKYESHYSAYSNATWTQQEMERQGYPCRLWLVPSRSRDTTSALTACDCCCLAAMTTKFESWVNGFTEEEVFPFKSASQVAEMYRTLGSSYSKYVETMLLCHSIQTLTFLNYLLANELKNVTPSHRL